MIAHATRFDEVWSTVEPLSRRQRAILLIDGGAGSGKTTLAGALAERWLGVQVVGLDSCYPGWDGLAEASRIVVDTVLRPSRPGYRRWDWTHSRPAEWVGLNPSAPLIVEGCGALTPASRALADLTLWCDLESAERRRRAIARDGELFEAHWDEWEAQEAEHWHRNRPWELADLVVAVSQP